MSRWLAVPAFVGLACCSQAQIDTSIFTSALRAARNRGQLAPPIQRNVTDIGGFPGLQSRQGQLPPPLAGGENERDLKIVHTDEIERSTSGDLTLKGGVEIHFRGYQVFADEARGNLNSEIFDFFGHVKLIGQKAVIEGQSVMVEFKTGFFRAIDTDADFRPAVSPGFLLNDAYMKSSKSEGTQREVYALDSTATTCNYRNPHYEILAARADIRPYRRAIFHDVDLVVLNHKIVHLPFISVPLNEPNYNYIPQFGRSAIEGYFMKSRYGIPLRRDVNSFDARVDYFSKLGSGLGGDYRYGTKVQNTLGIYGLPSGPRSFEINNHHLQRLGKLDVTLDNEFQSHNYLIDPDAVSLSSRALLTYARRQGTTRLTYRRASSATSGFDSVSQNVGLTDDRNISTRLHSSVQLNWSGYETSGIGFSTITRKQLDLNTDIKDELSRATAELQYQRSIPIGQTSNFFNSSDRTPVLSLKSDARRMFGSRMQSILPFTSELSTGQFTDPIRDGHIERTIFDLNANRSDLNRGKSSLALNGRFRQGIYSDDTAQFLVGYGGQYGYRLGRDTAFHLNYNFLRPEGFSPLAMDRTGRTDLVTSDISVRPFRTFLIGAQTGYDFLQVHNPDSFSTPWQSIGMRTEFTPIKDLSIRTLETYDTFQKGWSNLRGDLSFKRGPTFIALGVRYDAQRETLGNANLYVTALRLGRLSADVRLEYNGYLKQVQAQQYGLVYDLHCAEAVVQVLDNTFGFNSGRQVQFFLRLKAVPFSSFFGTGVRGQPIGTSTGRDGY